MQHQMRHKTFLHIENCVKIFLSAIHVFNRKTIKYCRCLSYDCKKKCEPGKWSCTDMG